MKNKIYYADVYRNEVVEFELDEFVREFNNNYIDSEENQIFLTSNEAESWLKKYLALRS